MALFSVAGSTPSEGFELKSCRFNAGDGPLRDRVLRFSECNPNIEYLGRLSPEKVSGVMFRASCLVMASNWYEGFPMVIVEALAHSLPVIVPRLGNMASIVEDGISGLHYTPKDTEELADAARLLINKQDVQKSLALKARKVYLEEYTEERNREILKNIYSKVIDRSIRGGVRV